MYDLQCSDNLDSINTGKFLPLLSRSKMESCNYYKKFWINMVIYKIILCMDKSPLSPNQAWIPQLCPYLPWLFQIRYGSSQAQ